MSSHQSQQQQEENRRARSVRFDDDTQDIPVEYPTPESDSTIWYTMNEVRTFVQQQRADAIRLSNAVATAVPGAMDTDEWRIQMLGLESFMAPSVAVQMAQNRHAHRNSVLGEQARQGMLNLNEAHLLSQISEQRSRLAREAAYQLALRFSNIPN